MTYDLIIVTQSKGNLIQVTQNCIDSARKDGADLNIVIVETGNPYRYDVEKIVPYNGVFNYNRALNLGLRHAKGDVHILANNDLIFHEGWSKIGELMRINNYHSASALSQDPRQANFPHDYFIYEGYQIGVHLTGWCIFVDRDCIEQIKQLDETVSFWYSDDLYACQLKSLGIKHALFCNIQVDHLISATLSVQPRQVQKQYMRSEYYKFNLRRRFYAKSNRIGKVNT